jgi:acyl dehydratase
MWEAGLMPIDYEKAMSLQSVDQPYSYGDRETMLYAMGIGLGRDPLDKRELPFVYESGLRAVPTQATVSAWGAGRLGETGLNYMMVVHGEQRLAVHQTLPPAADILADWKVTEVVDKGAGKGALIYADTTLKLKSTGAPLCTLGSTIFARADGGFGGPSTGGPSPHVVPTRPHDREVRLETREDQALLYRLSGDRNPLHSDPDLAKAAGFDRPILHGLCTYGFACRAVLTTYADYDPTAIRTFDVRFSSPVFPGETILVRLWRDGAVVSFEADVAERGVTVLKGGRCLLAA